MRIIVDAMGGDNAPESAVWGGALAAKEYGEEVLLVGKPEVVANVLKEKGLSDVKGITIMPANDLVDMHDDPATVLRRKPDSSMAVAFKLLKAGEGDALVSAGNTGALGILRAVVDKADTRFDDTVYLLRIQRSEERELEQHFGGAFGVCPRIAQHDLTVRARHNRCQCTASDALDAAAVQRRAGQ